MAVRQKWRLLLRTALFVGNVVAFILLVQDASQQFSNTDHDYRPTQTDRRGGPRISAANNNRLGLKPPRLLAMRMGKRRRQQARTSLQIDDIGSNSDAIELLPGHIPHPMQRGRKQQAAYAAKTAAAAAAALQDGGGTINPPNFTHYFIHIPKAGGTYARHQLNKDVRDNRLVRKRDILCDRGVSPVSNYKLWPQYFEHERKVRDRKKIEAAAEAGEEIPKKKILQKCGLYMTESHWSSIPDHVYTIVRDPREHVVSAYFHCKESKHHGKLFGHLMPDTLDEWLGAWADVKRASLGLQQGKALKKTEKFRCYNPINIQSSMLLSSEAGGEEEEEEEEEGKISKASLAKRFDVVGLTSQMDKSLCLVFIAWNSFVPDRCVCGGDPDQEKGEPGGSDNDSDEDELADLRLVHHGAVHSHNVTNHGGTHNHTAEQLLAIEQLADIDMKLYAVAEELFEDQVAEVEKKYSIKLC